MAKMPEADGPTSPLRRETKPRPAFNSPVLKSIGYGYSRQFWLPISGEHVWGSLWSSEAGKCGRPGRRGAARCAASGLAMAGARAWRRATIVNSSNAKVLRAFVFLLLMAGCGGRRRWRQSPPPPPRRRRRLGFSPRRSLSNTIRTARLMCACSNKSTDALRQATRNARSPI